MAVYTPLSQKKNPSILDMIGDNSQNMSVETGGAPPQGRAMGYDNSGQARYDMGEAAPMVDMSIIDMLEKNQVEQAAPDKADMTESSAGFKNAGQAALQSMQAGGGLGGALTSGGTMLGLGSLGAAEGTSLAGMGGLGLGLAAGGMLLSAHDKKKQEQAQRNQDAINAEMAKRKNLMDIALKSSDNDFSLV